MWLLTAHNKLEGTLGKVEATLVALQTQLGRMESKLGEVEKEVHGHGNWMHTLKAFAAVVVAIIVWGFINGLWPWLKGKLGIPAS